MAQRRNHAERAFERLIRDARIPYVAVNEAKKSLLPSGAGLQENPETGGNSLKNFDFIVYGDATNLLVEVKGRTIPRTKRPLPPGKRPRMECWVTRDDIDALRTWQRLFGPGYEAVIVFMYTCEGPPPDGLFGEVVELAGVWYAVRAIALDDYEPSMRTRSPRWRTVQLDQATFDRLSRPFAAPATASAPLGPTPALEPLMA